jgi:hypothetical protein
MQIRVGMENNFEGRSLAWALDFPGCFAYGDDETDSLIRLPGELLNFEVWIKDHTPDSWVNFEGMDFRIAEHFTGYSINEQFEVIPTGQGYEVNAWFNDDWRPLTEEEISHAISIFRWQRDELLAGLSTIEHNILEKERPGQRWNIIGIAKHIANAEFWYMQRMGLTDLKKEDLAEDMEERLTQTAALVEEQFPKFPGQVKVVGVDGEFWSFRKIVRRTLWHQRDHIEHIKELVFGESS